LALAVGCAVGLASDGLSSAAHAEVEAAQQASVPAPVSASQPLLDKTNAVKRLLPRLVDRGAALFLLAHDYALLGERLKALDRLKQCIALEEGFDPTGDLTFLSLRSAPEFHNLAERVRWRNPPVHRAHVAFTVLAIDDIQFRTRRREP